MMFIHGFVGSQQYFSTYKFVNLCSFKAEFEEIFGKIHVLLISSIKNSFILVFPFKDGLPYLFHSFRNKYFNKISLGNMLYFQNKL